MLAPLFPPAVRGGGPIRTLAALVAQAPADDDLVVLTSDRDLGDARRLDVPRDWVERDGASVRYLDATDARSAIRALERIDRPALLYCNSFFNVPLSILPRAWAARRRVPVLLAPRGELSEAALAIKPGRKRLFRAAARVLRLDRSAIWHASSRREAADIRRAIGSRARIIVREDESSLPATADVPPPSDGMPSLVFLSRLVPNKGLHLLLEGLQGITLPWRLDVYGTEEDAAYVERCRLLARHPALHGNVTFHGALEPQRVRQVLREHDAFPFPTSTENFGHVIAEALSVSCPVLVADTTPWTPRIASGAGVVVDGLDVAAWRAALVDYLGLDGDRRAEMRERARTAYDGWRAETSAPHVLDLVRSMITAR